jgi:hypothetical protein
MYTITTDNFNLLSEQQKQRASLIKNKFNELVALVNTLPATPYKVSCLNFLDLSYTQFYFGVNHS